MRTRAIRAKKILSLLLTVLLLFSVFPVSAYAEGVTPEITAAEEDGPVDQQQEGPITDPANLPEVTNGPEEIAGPEETTNTEEKTGLDETTDTEETTESEEIDEPEENDLEEISETDGTTEVFLPPQVELFAENEAADFQSLKEAISNAQAGDTIIITGDIDFTGTLIIEKSLTFKATEEAGVLAFTSAVGRHIAIPIGCDVTLTFDGIVLNGAGTGGGITVSSNAALTLKNAIIYDCAFSGSGGGISVNPNGSLIIEGGRIADNKASSNGGGIFGTFFSEITIMDCQISGNTAMGEGGGGIAGSTVNILVSGSTISGNRAKDGGGIYGYASEVTIADSEISGNTADHNGGGIWSNALEYLTVTEDVVFTGNKASQAFLMTEEGDIALHDEKIKTTHFSSPDNFPDSFRYAYNNYDVAYTNGTPYAAGMVVVRYEDAGGNTVAPSETYTGIVGESYTITPPVIPGYSVREVTTGRPTYTGTYALEQQTIVFRYMVKSGGAAHYLYSFGIQTSRTVTPMVNADYMGNVIYYPDAGDTLTGFYDMYVLTAVSGQSTDITYFPEDEKQILNGLPELTFGLYDDAAPMSAEELAGYGYWITVLYSTDHGASFTAIAPDDLSDVNAIGIRLIKADNATTLESSTNPLVITAEFPIRIDTDRLTEEETNGAAVLEGWRFKTPSQIRPCPVGVFLSSPRINGTVHQQELSGTDNLNWASAGILAGQTVELLDENGLVIATAVTNENGEYTFAHIGTMDKLQIRITTADGDVYFEDADTGNFQQTDIVSVGSITDIDRTLDRFPNVTWKTSAGDVDTSAGNSQNARFIVVTRLNSVPAITYTAIFNCQGGSAVSPVTNIAGGSTITAPENPIRAGYSFAGWYKELSCENAWNFENDTVTDNITLYAKWTAATNNDDNSNDNNNSNNSSNHGGGNSSNNNSSNSGNDGSNNGNNSDGGNGNNSSNSGGENGSNSSNDGGGNGNNSSNNDEGNGSNSGSGEENSILDDSSNNGSETGSSGEHNNGDPNQTDPPSDNSTDSSNSGAIMKEPDTSEAGGDLDEIPKTGEAGVSWVFYITLMLVSLIGLSVLTCKKEQE